MTGMVPHWTTGMVPHWTPDDEKNLRDRIERLKTSAQRMPLPRAVSFVPNLTTCVLGCKEGDHHHAVRQVGPYRICRCIHCSDLVVG